MPSRPKEVREKISQTMTGRRLSESHKESISTGHAAYKESGAFYWTDEYRQKMSEAKKGYKHSEATKRVCRAAVLRRHHGNATNTLNEHQVPIANDRPDWLKDYI